MMYDLTHGYESKMIPGRMFKDKKDARSLDLEMIADSIGISSADDIKKVMTATLKEEKENSTIILRKALSIMSELLRDIEGQEALLQYDKRKADAAASHVEIVAEQPVSSEDVQF